MTPKKYVMLVENETGPLARLIPRLRELDFRLVRISDPAAALDFVQAFPKLAMAVVHDSDGRDTSASARLVASIRKVQPNLPLLWHGPRNPALDGLDVEVLPNESLTAGDLVASAERLLCQHFYPAEFSSFLAETSLEAFASFAAHGTPADPFLKASRVRLGDFSAVIAFSGPRTSGHLVVTAPRAVAAEAYARLFGDSSPPSDDEIVDVLGECANRIVGRLASYFERRGFPFSFGVPLYLAGANSVLWQGAHRPALAIEFETVHGRMFSELCIDAFDVDGGAAHFPEDLLRSGHCVLL